MLGRVSVELALIAIPGVQAEGEAPAFRAADEHGGAKGRKHAEAEHRKKRNELKRT